MKKRSFLIFLLTFIIFFSYSVPVLSVADTTELNWYYVPKDNHEIPEGAKESVNFLKNYDAYYLGDTTSKVLYLTFDEGYENGNTPAILDILKELKIPAAFFVVKPYIDSQPDIIKRMVKEGHLVCNHSNTHPSMASIINEEKFNSEFSTTEDAFKKLTGKDMPKFFRPPMGKYSQYSLEKTQALGYKTIFWSFAYRDWLIDDQPDESYAIEKIESSVHPGGILLLHAVSDTNTKVLKQVLLDLQKDGYKFKSLNDLPTEEKEKK